MDQLYIDVISQSLLSTIIWPLASDTTFFAMLAWGGFDMRLAFWCAVGGASVGAAVNYGLGRLLAKFQTNGISTISPEKYELWQKRAVYFVPFIGLLCWIHLVAAFVVALGFLRVRAIYVLPALVLGQAIYYGHAIS